jgi:hypothetical protein
MSSNKKETPGTEEYEMEVPLFLKSWKSSLPQYTLEL